MVAERQIALMHRVLDGEATPAERARLNALLDENPDAHRLYTDLEATSDLLAQVETVTPSPNLKKRVMNALPADRYARQKRQSFGRMFAPLWEALRARPALGYAYATALGILIGVVTYAVFADPTFRPDPADVSGTLAPAAVTQEFPLALPELQGAVRVTTQANHLIVHLNLEAQAETEVRLAFDPGTLRWHSLQRLDEGTGSRLITGDGIVHLTVTSPAQYALTFNEARQPSLTLTLLQDGRTLYRQSLSSNPVARD